MYLNPCLSPFLASLPACCWPVIPITKPDGQDVFKVGNMIVAIMIFIQKNKNEFHCGLLMPIPILGNYCPASFCVLPKNWCIIDRSIKPQPSVLQTGTPPKITVSNFLFVSCPTIYFIGRPLKIDNNDDENVNADDDKHLQISQGGTSAYTLVVKTP